MLIITWTTFRSGNISSGPHDGFGICDIVASSIKAVPVSSMTTGSTNCCDLRFQ